MKIFGAFSQLTAQHSTGIHRYFGDQADYSQVYSQAFRLRIDKYLLGLIFTMTEWKCRSEMQWYLLDKPLLGLDDCQQNLFLPRWTRMMNQLSKTEIKL